MSRETEDENERRESWVKTLKSKLHSPGTVLTVELLLWAIETSSGVFTFLTGLSHGPEVIKSWTALTLHVCTGVVLTLVMYWKKQKSVTTIANGVLLFFSYICFCTKPVRYVQKYLNTTRIRDASGVVNRIKAEATRMKTNLDNDRVDKIECFINIIPSTIVQTFFLVVTYEYVTLCNYHDISRVTTIIASILSAAKSAAKCDVSTVAYSNKLDELAYHVSRKQLPFVKFTKESIAGTKLCSTVCHFMTIFHVFYATLYFTIITPFLGALYLALMFTLKSTLLLLLPQLEDPFQNPPAGVNSSYSYAIDRFVNVISNTGTRYNRFVDPFRYSRHVNWKFPLPIIIFQVVQVTPLLLTLWLSFHINNTIESNTSTCPNLDASFYGNVSIFKTLSEWVFAKTPSFKELFTGAYVIGLSVYAQVLFVVVHAFADLYMRVTGDTFLFGNRAVYFVDTFPSVPGYAFFRVLLGRCLQNQDLRCLRTLMLMVTIRECEFYCNFHFKWFGFEKLHCTFFECSCTRMPGISNDLIRKLGKRVAKRFDKCGVDVNQTIDQCVIDARYRVFPFVNEFNEIKRVIDSHYSELPRNRINVKQHDRDLKLFAFFYSHFDQKIRVLSSWRVKKMFGVIGVEVFEWGGDVTGVGVGGFF